MDFQEEREYFLKIIMDIISEKDVLKEAVIYGTNFKSLLEKFKGIFGLLKEEQEFFVSYLIEIIFQREDIRTESRVLMLRLLN